MNAISKISMIGNLSAFSGLAMANELDGNPTTQKAPAALVMRVDAQGNQEVFTSTVTDKVTNDAAAQSVAADALNNGTKITATQATSELDKSSSTAAWYYRHYPNYYGYYGCNYGYNYNYYGYNYYYTPYYSYYTPYYSYYYYYY